MGETFSFASGGFPPRRNRLTHSIQFRQHASELPARRDELRDTECKYTDRRGAVKPPEKKSFCCEAGDDWRPPTARQSAIFLDSGQFDPDRIRIPLPPRTQPRGVVASAAPWREFPTCFPPSPRGNAATLTGPTGPHKSPPRAAKFVATNYNCERYGRFRSRPNHVKRTGTGRYTGPCKQESATRE